MKPKKEDVKGDEVESSKEEKPAEAPAVDPAQPAPEAPKKEEKPEPPKERKLGFQG